MSCRRNGVDTDGTRRITQFIVAEQVEGKRFVFLSGIDVVCCVGDAVNQKVDCGAVRIPKWIRDGVVDRINRSDEPRGRRENERREFTCRNRVPMAQGLGRATRINIRQRTLRSGRHTRDRDHSIRSTRIVVCQWIDRDRYVLRGFERIVVCLDNRGDGDIDRR